MRILAIIFGVLMAIAGIYCVSWPTATFLALGYAVGIAMLIDGIGRLVDWITLYRNMPMSGWVLASSVISLLFGVVLVGSSALQHAVDAFIYYAAVAWFIVMGIMRIVSAVRVKKVRNVIEDGISQKPMFGQYWWAALLTGILLVACGVAGIFFPGAFMAAIGLFIGISIIISGVNLVFLGIVA